MSPRDYFSSPKTACGRQAIRSRY